MISLVTQSPWKASIPHHLHGLMLTPTNKHGRNLVGDTGDVSPPLFLFRFCIWKGFKNKSVFCHVLCEELSMLDGRPYIVKLMLKQSLVWCHWFY